MTLPASPLDTISRTPFEPDLEEREEAIRERLTIVRHALRSIGAPAALLRTRHNFAWLTAGGENHVVLNDDEGTAPILVTSDDVVVLAPVNDASRIRDEALGLLPIEVVDLPWHQPEAIAAEARRRAGGQPVDDPILEDLLWPARVVLRPFEWRRLHRLGRQIRHAVADTLATTAPGDTEDAAVAALVARLVAAGIRTPVLLAAADERISRYRHPLPSQHPIEHRLMLVVVAEQWGLHVALSRFREFDAPDSETARRLAATHEVLEAMFAATREGETLGTVFDVARDTYGRLGFPDEWRLHHQGGLIGYRSRERIAVPGDPTVIASRMAFAWNPSIGGAKAEDTAIVASDGALSFVTTDDGVDANAR